MVTVITDTKKIFAYIANAVKPQISLEVPSKAIMLTEASPDTLVRPAIYADEQKKKSDNEKSSGRHHKYKWQDKDHVCIANSPAMANMFRSTLMDLLHNGLIAFPHIQSPHEEDVTQNNNPRDIKYLEQFCFQAQEGEEEFKNTSVGKELYYSKDNRLAVFLNSPLDLIYGYAHFQSLIKQSKKMSGRIIGVTTCAPIKHFTTKQGPVVSNSIPLQATYEPNAILPTINIAPSSAKDTKEPSELGLGQIPVADTVAPGPQPFERIFQEIVISLGCMKTFHLPIPQEELTTVRAYLTCMAFLAACSRQLHMHIRESADLHFGAGPFQFKFDDPKKTIVELTLDSAIKLFNHATEQVKQLKSIAFDPTKRIILSEGSLAKGLAQQTNAVRGNKLPEVKDTTKKPAKGRQAKVIDDQENV